MRQLGGLTTWFSMGLLVLGAMSSLLEVPQAQAEDKEVPATLNFKMKDLKGKTVDLSRYKGKVVLIVNTASECGFTPQYEGLQELHKEYGPEGLAILGFPSNDFGRQEPGTDEEIADFCKKNYGVEFDMFSKVGVLGKQQCDLYKFLTSKETNPKFSGRVTWNFEKFLLDRDGQIVGRFAPSVKPSSQQLVSAIKKQLQQK